MAVKLKLTPEKGTEAEIAHAHTIHQQAQVVPWKLSTFEDCFTKPYYGVFAYENEQVIGYARWVEGLAAPDYYGRMSLGSLEQLWIRADGLASQLKKFRDEEHALVKLHLLLNPRNCLGERVAVRLVAST